MDKTLRASSSPHVRNTDSISTVMTDVLIALIPACAMGVYYFGKRAFFILLISALSAIFFEAAYQYITKQKITVLDGSAAVTGLLIGMIVPHTVPFWTIIICNAFAIIIVKQFFGGLGNNFINPAISARAFALASWPTMYTSFVTPFDGISSATVLEAGYSEIGLTVKNALIGYMSGCIGETCKIAIILGGLYLIIRKVITPRIPVCYILTVIVFSAFYERDITFVIMQVLSGGLLLGAIFMATDYVTSPVTPWGQVVYAVGCGIITSVIRFYGGYPEGVTYAILLMNALTPLIDKYIKVRRYGGKASV